MLRKLLQKRNNILFLILITLSVYLLFMYLAGQFGGRYETRCTELMDDWRVIHRGTAYENTNYHTFLVEHGGDLSAGDTIICEKTLSDMGEKSFPSVMIKTRQSAVEAYFDDEEVYSADMDLLEKGAFIGRRVRFITLPRDYIGKTLRVHIHISRGGFSEGYRAPFFGDYRDLFWLYVDSSVPSLLTGVFLFLFGITFLFMALHFSMREERTMQAISAILCMTMGAWIVCYNDFLRLFLRDDHSTEAEYLVFYLLLPLLLLFVDGLYHIKYVRLAGFAGVGFSALLLLLHIARVMHLSTFSFVYQILAMISFVAILGYFFAIRLRGARAEDVNVREVGLIILVISMLVYYVTYIFEGFLGIAESSFAMLMPSVGMLSFATMQILYYYLYVSESYAKTRELETLSEMAFVDVLTGLPNRKSAENMLEQLNNIDSEYCVLSLDVNGLKTVNDTMGHGAGDKLLQLTAGVLNRSFREGSFRARLSGDEFLVIMRDTTMEKVEVSIKLLHRMFLELDKMEPEVTHSISCGYAFRSELPRGSAQAVYNLADERMYKAKREYYEKQKIFAQRGKEAKAI